MSLRVIYLQSNAELPDSVRQTLPDDVAATILRVALNSHLADGRTEMHSYIRAYRALEDAGYVWDEETKTWKVPVQKDSPTASDVHVDAPLGSRVPAKRTKPLEPGEVEELEPALKADSVSVDVPLLIRLLELAREEIQDDVPVHDLAEKLIELSADKRTLTMDDYAALQEAAGVEEDGGEDGEEEVIQEEEQSSAPAAVEKYLPPVEVIEAARQAAAPWGEVTEQLAKGEGLDEATVRDLASAHALGLSPEAELAWGGALAGKWALRVLRKIERDSVARKYSEDQERDDNGRWTSGGESSGGSLVTSKVMPPLRPSAWGMPANTFFFKSGKFKSASDTDLHIQLAQKMGFKNEDAAKRDGYVQARVIQQFDGKKSLTLSFDSRFAKTAAALLQELQGVSLSYVGVDAGGKTFSSSAEDPVKAIHAWIRENVQKEDVEKYSPSQPRDEEGRWTVGGDADYHWKESVARAAKRFPDAIRSALKVNWTDRNISGGFAFNPITRAILVGFDPGGLEVKHAVEHELGHYSYELLSPERKDEARALFEKKWIVHTDITRRYEMAGKDYSMLADRKQVHEQAAEAIRLVVMGKGKDLPAKVKDWATSAIRDLKAIKVRKEDPYEPWHAFDFHGTLITTDKPFSKDDVITGVPVPNMVEKAKEFLRRGERVKILTAAVADDPDGSVARQIADWCERHIGTRLEVTNEKDPGMIDLRDDKAVGVEENTGVEKADEDAGGDADGEWVTINGNHVLIRDDGSMVGPKALVDSFPRPSTKAELARRNYVAANKDEQRRADHTEAALARALGAERTRDNSPFDLKVGRWGLEVKTFLVTKNAKVTMKKDAMDRKRKEARREKLRMGTIVADKRSGKTQYYFTRGIGSFRLGSLKPMTLAELKETLTGVKKLEEILEEVPA